MKKKNILLVILLFMIMLLFALVFFKMSYNDNSIDHISDSEKYDDMVIKDNVKNVDYYYAVSVLDEILSGKVYIDEDNLLHITVSDSNDDVVVSDIPFKTIYKLAKPSYGSLSIFLISLDNDLYYLSLNSNDINSAEVVKINLDYKITNFTKLTFKGDETISYNTLLVLSDDGNIYDITSGLRYDPNIKLLFDNVIVYKDLSFSNVYGKMFTDDNDIKYKIKYAFMANETVEENEKTSAKIIIIITNDDRLLVSHSSDLFNETYENEKKVKTVTFNSKNPMTYGNLTITFVDGSILQYDAMCSNYFNTNNS